MASVTAMAEAGGVRAQPRWGMVLLPVSARPRKRLTSVAVELRHVHVGLNRVHPLTGAGCLHRQHWCGASDGSLRPASTKTGRERLKAPDNLRLWQLGIN